MTIRFVTVFILLFSVSGLGTMAWEKGTTSNRDNGLGTSHGAVKAFATAASVNDPTVNENVGVLTFTISLDNPAPAGGATIDFSTSNGSATAGTDYALTSGQLSFASGEDSKTVDVAISGDNMVEADETLTLTLSNPTGINVSIADATGTGTIVNDDQATVTIADESGNEDDGAITITVTLDVAVDGGGDVDVSTADGSATTADNDYTAVTNQTLTFAGTAGETQTFTVTPTADATLESDETVSIRISRLFPVTVAGDAIDITDVATLTITNDDDISASIDAPDVTEGDGGTATLQFTVTLSHIAPAGGATIDFATSDVTATAGTDYTAISGQLVFSVGEDTQTIDVSVMGDEIVEIDETLTVTLSNPTGTDVVIGDASGTGTIRNDDRTTVTVDDVTEDEAGTFTLTLTSSNEVVGGFAIDVNTADGTAAAGDDYTALVSESVSFDGTVGEQETLTLSVNDDAIVEADETLVVSLDNVIPVTVDGIDIDIRDVAIVTITNNDFPEVNLSVDANVGTETDQTLITVTATASQAVSENQTVDLGVSGTGITNTDYDLSNSTITILDGATMGTVTFTIQDDLVVEGLETVILTMSNPSAGLNLGVTTAQNIAITDNDLAGFTLAESGGNTVVSESGSTDDFTVVLDAQPTAEVTFAVSSGDVTEATVSPSTLTFTASNWNTPQTVTITGVDDAINDGDVVGTITVNPASANTAFDALANQMIAVTTINDEGTVTSTVNLSVSVNTGTEAAGTAITVTATASLAVSGDQTIDLGVSGTDITATDYTLSNTQITIPDDQTTGTVTFTVQDDAVIEELETATLTISNPSAGLTLGATIMQDISITDNDIAGFTLVESGGNSVVSETGTTDHFTVILDAQPTANVTFAISSSDVTEISVSPSTLTFTGSNWNRPRTVTITGEGDGINDGDLVSRVTVNPASADTDFNALANQTIAVTIIDQEGAVTTTVDLSVSANTGTEADGSVITVTATASQAVSGNQTVGLGVSGTGITGTDYTLDNTTITIPDGLTTGSVTFTIQDDSDIEGTETATLTISTAPAGFILGATITQNITITDNDFPSITYGGTGFDEVVANNGSVSGSITATLTDDTFKSALSVGTDVTLGNIPAGLTPSVTVEKAAQSWTGGTVAANEFWDSIVYGNGLFVAVGLANIIMTSPDGTNWTARTAAADNWWTSVTYGNGLFVAVASNGTNQVMTSPDGINWTARTAAADNWWTSVTYSNGLFVAVSLDGTDRVMTSPDGITWTARTAAENNTWLSVTYGGGLFVAVSLDGTNRVMTSSDGINWTARTAATNNKWRDITYGNGLFVAVSENGSKRVMTSPDGINWTARTAAANNMWQSVTYGNGLFVAVSRNGTNRVMTSPDGITWTARTAAADNEWFRVSYGNDLFVAVSWTGTDRLMTSSANDMAILSLTGNANPHTNAQDVSDITFDFANSAFTGGNATNVINATGPASSNLGVDFDDPILINLSVSSNTGSEADGTAITVTATASRAVSGNQTVDLGVSGTGIMGTDYSLSDTQITILDGQTTGTVTFTIQDDTDIEETETAMLTISNPSIGMTLGTTTTQNIVIADNDFPSITYGGTGFDEVVANDGSVTGNITTTLTGDTFKSTLAIGTDVTLGNIPAGLIPSVTIGTSAQSWTARTAAENNFWDAVTYGNGLFVAVAHDGTNQIMTSPDGINWTARAAVAANAWTSVTYGNGLFVAVAAFGTNQIMTSPDGINWTARTAAENKIWVSVTYDNGLFVAVSIDGTDRVMTSLDGINWTSRTAAENNSWRSVTYGNGLFVAVASDGTHRVMTSPDGIIWTARAAAENNFWFSVTYGNGLFVAVASDGTHRVMTSPDGINWTSRTAAANSPWGSVTHGNGLFVAMAAGGTHRVMTSPDGINWTSRTAAVNNDWRFVSYGNGLFVTVSSSGTNRVMTSTAKDMAILSLTSNANPHTNTEDVSDITFDFANSAFTGGNVANVINAAGPASSNLGVDFDDPTLINLSVSANTGTEAAGTVMTVTATASQAVSGDQTVDLGVSGTGITGTDYTLNNTTITILDGATTGTVDFTIQDDADVEGTETATLTISNPSAGLTLGATSTEDITITDDDFPTVALSVSPSAGTETAGTVITVTATASQAVSGDQTVDLSVSGTGITGADYTLTGTTITILDGATTGTVDFTILDDADIEGDETAILEISNPSAGLTLGATATQSVTITDDDFPTVELSVSASAGTEAAGTVITVTATASSAVSGDQTVDLSVSGTGITGADYTLTGTTITILDGATTGTVDFTILDDADVEGTETANLVISNPSAGLTLGATSTQDITITDDDFPTVELSLSPSTGTEAAGTVITVTATASQAVSGDQTVDLGVSGTGITGMDYTLNSTTITILDGTTTGTVDFTIQDDVDIEGTETATLTISNPSAGLALGATSTQDITITDDDFPTVALSVSPSAGTEAAGTVITVTATASSAVSGDQTVDLSVSGTGITGADYTLTGTTITILDGATTGTVDFTILDDADVEGTETANLVISNPSAGLTLGATSTQDITITDDDFPTVELSVSPSTGTEAAGTVITVKATASSAVSGDQTVDLGVSGTGISGTDYMLSGTTITILDGATTGTVDFTIQDDADIEGTETATLTISNPSAGLTLGATSTQDITITDDDFPTVELSVSPSAGTEAAGTVITVTATASQAVSGDQTVDLGVSGTGITGADYILTGATITILDGATTGTVDFTIQDDADVEGLETATLTISNPSAGVSLGSTTTQDITITDDDFPTVELSVSPSTGTEAAGTVITVKATASSAVSGDQTVDLGVSGTGISGTDYMLSGTTITILDGATTGTVDFTIQDDTDVEGLETATLTISNPSAGVSLGSTTTQDITITDDDFPTVELSVSPSTGTEAAGTVITVTATASQAVSGDQTVDLGVSGTGITGMDYTLISTTITILDGAITGMVTFTIQDDADVEGTETATLTISNPSAGLTLGATSTQDITITDDDFPTVELSVSPSTGTEAAGTVMTVTATASQAVSGDQTVDLGVSGTGITGTDYTLNNTTITILDGATTGTVDFTIQDDSAIEGAETATLTISNPSAGLTLGATSTQDITITDDDFPTVELSVSPSTGTEAAGTVITVTATASQAVSGDQTVDLGVSGTGITGTDYTLNNTTITILDGATTGTVDFTIQDDADVEGTETATLTISNPSEGLALGATSTQDITITDDDFPTVELSVSPSTGTEAAGTVITVTATASQAVSGDQTVDLGVSGTGITGTDYTLNNTTITILDGATTGTVDFTIQDDADVEGTETATLTISNPSAGLTLGATSTQDITITDDDFPTVELSVSPSAGTEAAGTVIIVTATASQAVSGDQTVDLGVSGTGITGADYTLTGTTITILDGATTGTVDFTIQDDSDVEEAETATLTISNPSVGLTLGTTTSQNVTITDNDLPTVELSVSANSGTEAAGTVITVTATASQAVSGDQTVDLGVSGTGITGADYTLTGTTITILDGATTGTVDFTIQDDSDVEEVETATLTISNPSVGLTLGTTTSQNVTITDNDLPTVELSVSANSGTEAAGTVITVTATASQAVSGDQTIDLGVSGTGITGTDYTLNNTTITILDGATTGNVDFTIQDDAGIEGTETATLTISNPSEGLALGATSTQDITITDDDFPTVELSVSPSTGTEAAGTVITVTATASSAVSGDQTVDLGVSGTGITGADYTLNNAAITILDGATTGNVDFTIQDDSDVEGTETATLTISNPSAGLTLGANTSQEVTIIDNDEVEPDLINTTIMASPTSLVADGVATSLITVQLVDSDGNALTISRGIVTLNVTGSALLTAVSDNGDGTYTAMLTNTVAEVVTVTGQWDGLKVSTELEVEFTPDNTDTDGDGVFDRLEDLNMNGDLEDDDTDRDGTPNYLDTDDDGDSIPTREEDIDEDGDPQNDDTDQDQIPNYLDDDDDNDGIPTIDEDANGNLDLFDDDTDGDGIPNFLDPIENMVVDKLLSPNGDGINDVLQIQDAEKFPNNKVSIFNRQGNLIFEIDGYDNKGRAWNGIPNKGLLASGDKIVPNGTYFYVIDPNDGSETITGFFIVKR